MSRPSRVRAMALGALLAAAGCQDYNFNPVGHCLIAPNTKRVQLSDVSTADVLFVVDDSGSMAGNQTKLAQAFDTFINELDASNQARVAPGQGLKPIDFHLAVTTTSVFYNAPTGAVCRNDCPGATSKGNVCCQMAGSTPLIPLHSVQPCTGPSDTCADGQCRQDCQENLGDWVCCDPTTKAPALNTEVSCEALGDDCGTLQTHYVWNSAHPNCSPGNAVNWTPYPQGRFVAAAGNPRVIHFDKELYTCATPPCTGTVNKQGYTADQLKAFFKSNIVAGTCGSGEEQALEAGKLAVQLAMGGGQRDVVSTTSQTPGDYPAAWPHDHSKLVLVFVGDEDDCSSPADPSGGIVLYPPLPTDPPGTPDACVLDVKQKRFPVSDFVDYFSSLPGDRPLGAAVVVSAKSATGDDVCVDEACRPGLCCDYACTGTGACMSDICGGKAAGTRLLDAAASFRGKNADVVGASICDPDFGTILGRIAEIVKPPTGLLLPTQPADSVVSVLRIAGSDGKTRKTCRGPAPATLTAAQAKHPVDAAGNAIQPYDWWFTATREQLDDASQQPTAPSRFVYINHESGSCEASPGETYSADYIARLPTTGCFGATAQEADDSCVATLGGRPGDWTCFAGTDGLARDHCVVPTGGAVVGTCICGARYTPPAGGSTSDQPGTGNCPWGCSPGSADDYCPMR